MNQRLFLSHTALADSIVVREFVWRAKWPVEREDLFQSAYSGLADAVVAHGNLDATDFTRLATVRIRGAVLNYIDTITGGRGYHASVRRGSCEPVQVCPYTFEAEAKEAVRVDLDNVDIPRLVAAIEQLPWKQKSIVSYYYLHGVLIADIALMFRVSHQAISQQLQKAYETLKTELMGVSYAV